MRFLLDTDTCSANLKNHTPVVGKVLLHFGALAVSVVSVGELMTWALRAKAPSGRLPGLQSFLGGVDVLDINVDVAIKFGELRALLFDQGSTVAEMDLFIAATAIVYGLCLVTHNTADFSPVPGLTLDDWWT